MTNLTNTANATNFMSDLSSAAGLLASVMMMRGLLDNKQPVVQASAPSAAPGVRLQEEDLYKQSRGLI